MSYRLFTSVLVVLCALNAGLLLPLLAAAQGARDECASCHATGGGDGVVCGSDGIAYASPCLAKCQGVAVAHFGECSASERAHAMLAAVTRAADQAQLTKARWARAAARAAARAPPAGLASAAPPGAGGPIPLEAMQRYAHRGFRLIGRAVEEAFEPGYISLPGQQQPQVQRHRRRRLRAAQAGGVAPTLSAPFNAAAVLKTADGYVYQLPPAATSAAELLAAAAVAAGDAAAAAAAVAQAGGERLPGFMPAGVGPGERSPTVQPGIGAAAAVPVIGSSNQVIGAASSLPPAPLSLPTAAPGAPGTWLAGRRLARRLAHIIGLDTRKERTDWPGYPFSAVGQVLFDKGSCSGVLIGPRHVLTAGHCVWSRKKGAWQAAITFTPYRHRINGADAWPFGRVPYVDAVTYQGWIGSPTYNDALAYDLAVITLAEDVGNRAGWLGVGWRPSTFDGIVRSAGYPGDKPFGSLWSTSCRVSDANTTDARFEARCDVSPGQSGSAVWHRAPPGRDQARYDVLAVLTYESCYCCSLDCTCCDRRYNGGTPVNPVHFASIRAWRER